MEVYIQIKSHFNLIDKILNFLKSLNFIDYEIKDDSELELTKKDLKLLDKAIKDKKRGRVYLINGKDSFSKLFERKYRKTLKYGKG